MDREREPASLTTPRLRLRPLGREDAPFILELLTDPAFLRYIGDRGVHDLETALAYIEQGPRASYATHGFGLLCVELREDGRPVGICGLLRRPSLDEVEVGFAFLPAFWSRGYASESAAAVVAHARHTLGLLRIAAITQLDNAGSIRVLERLGLRFERRVRLAPGLDELLLYA